MKKLTVVFLTILMIISGIPIISFAADEYNNTYVSYLGLVESNGNDGVVDGNIAFNSAGGSLTSDKNGNLTIDVPGMDKSNNNKVVRTFDNVAYNFEYNTGLINVDNPVTKAKCWLRITIYGDITEIAPTPTSLSDAFIGANGTNTWDGAIDSDKEKGIKGITVTLLKENEKGVYAPFTSVDDEGNGHTNMITNNEGRYQFENLPKGKYIVAFSGDFSEWDNLRFMQQKINLQQSRVKQLL